MHLKQAQKYLVFGPLYGIEAIETNFNRFHS